MRTSLGVSAGSEVVCSALLTTSPDGGQAFEYRTITADEANLDLGELVSSAIELMTTQVRASTGAEPEERRSSTVEPSGIAVAYRSKEQTRSIRSAVGPRRRDLQLVPEAAAALAYLHYTGEVAQFETVAIADLGATGLTITIVDQADGTVLASQRSTEVSGNAIDDALYRNVTSHRTPPGARPNRTEAISRVRTAKEHLSSHETTTIEYAPGRHRRVSRAEFDHLVAPFVTAAVSFTTRTLDSSPRKPDGLVLIGGGAHVQVLAKGLSSASTIPVLRPADPETVLAKGAALVADSAQPIVYPMVRMSADKPTGTFARVAGAMVGAVVVIGLIVGYGVQSLNVSDGDENVSPAATLDRTDQGALVNASPTTSVPAPPLPTYEYSEPTPEESPYGYPADGIPTTEVTTAAPRPVPVPRTQALPNTNPPALGSRPSTTAPPLHPAPDLRQIPWPQTPEWLDLDDQQNDPVPPPQVSPLSPDDSPSPAPERPTLPGTGSFGG
ncbi:Hsp70 family protein [Aldersonia kunmingensis]|uniref:Hsp70 family protein n=1 Tax=Aldersonia kunmingensis TaxID=408066 RepID=UPI000829E4F4|nr:Hsp70 family protein [Aldersonia kunmingensis]